MHALKGKQKLYFTDAYNWAMSTGMFTPADASDYALGYSAMCMERLNAKQPVHSAYCAAYVMERCNLTIRER